MRKHPIDHVGHRLEPAVRVPGCSLGLTRCIVDLPHLVHVHERVEVGHAHSGKRPPHRESSTSKPLGAGVTGAKGRSVIPVGSGSGTRGRAATLSTVTAGMEVSYQVRGDIPPGCRGSVGGADSGHVAGIGARFCPRTGSFGTWTIQLSSVAEVAHRTFKAAGAHPTPTANPVPSRDRDVIALKMMELSYAGVARERERAFPTSSIITFGGPGFGRCLKTLVPRRCQRSRSKS